MLFLKVIDRPWFCFFSLGVTVSVLVDLRLQFGLAYILVILWWVYLFGLEFPFL